MRKIYARGKSARDTQKESTHRVQERGWCIPGHPRKLSECKEGRLGESKAGKRSRRQNRLGHLGYRKDFESYLRVLDL
jgi:hypothetical protein